VPRRVDCACAEKRFPHPKTGDGRRLCGQADGGARLADCGHTSSNGELTSDEVGPAGRAARLGVACARSKFLAAPSEQELVLSVPGPTQRSELARKLQPRVIRRCPDESEAEVVGVLPGYLTGESSILRSLSGEGENPVGEG
jgi:hypothetical protein